MKAVSVTYAFGTGSDQHSMTKKKGDTIMKRSALVLTLAALLCAFTSCGSRSTDDTDASPVAMSSTKAVSEKTETAAPKETKKNEEESTVSTEAVTASEHSTAAVNTAESVTEQASQNETAPFAGTAFKRGTVNGNVYTSEYAGFRFTAPEGAQFYDEEQIERANTTPLLYMSEEEKSRFMTGTLDTSVRYTDLGGDVSIWYYDTKLRYPETPDISAEDFIQKEFFEADYEIRPKDMEGPEKVTVGGMDYVRFSWTSLGHPYCMYVRRIDDDFIVKIDAAEDAIGDIESRITAIE